MSENQFVCQRAAYIGNIKITCFRTNLRIEYHMKKNIAQLFSDIILVISHKRIGQFVDFLYCIRTQRLIGLLRVPRTLHPEFIENIKQPSELRKFFLSSMHWFKLLAALPYAHISVHIVPRRHFQTQNYKIYLKRGFGHLAFQHFFANFAWKSSLSILRFPN